MRHSDFNSWLIREYTCIAEFLTDADSTTLKVLGTHATLKSDKYNPIPVTLSDIFERFVELFEFEALPRNYLDGQSGGAGPSSRLETAYWTFWNEVLAFERSKRLSGNRIRAQE